VGSDLR